MIELSRQLPYIFEGKQKRFLKNLGDTVPLSFLELKLWSD